MLTFVRRNSDPAPATVLQLDDAACRGFVILCIVLLALGAADMIRFLVQDYFPLRAAHDDARIAYSVLEAGGSASRAALSEASATVEIAASAVMRGTTRFASYCVALLVIGWFVLVQRRRLFTRQQITNAMTLMILLVGVLLLSARLLLQKAIPNLAVWGLVDLIAMHLAVCLIMPISARDATLPFVPLLGVWAVTFLVPTETSLPLIDRVVGAIMSPLALLPGAAIASWRDRRRTEHAERLILGERVQLYGGELSRARIVHEAMFPERFTGQVEFDYDYQPIQEIGGDYVHAHRCPDTDCVIVTLLDVAGHGLAAALTVNRLFGELERIIAESAAADPAEIITLLNRYIYLTMSRHSLFATGMCMMLDPASGELKWVSSGHPPALLRRAGGQVEELPTTTMILGVQPPGDYDTNQQSMRLGPGDTVIAYTDGAMEARDANGAQFGRNRLHQTACFNPPPRNWPRFIAGAIAKHHGGASEDDVLIACLTLRSLRIGQREEVNKSTGQQLNKSTSQQINKSTV